jgi:hypothetical protein
VPHANGHGDRGLNMHGIGHADCDSDADHHFNPHADPHMPIGATAGHVSR